VRGQPTSPRLLSRAEAVRARAAIRAEVWSLRFDLEEGARPTATLWRVREIEEEIEALLARLESGES
jgi:hypothetical protein